MPPAKLTRDQALDLIGEVFRAHGYDGASLSLVSEATGLGRASLYHHFPGGKEAMARAVFEHLGQRVQAELLSPLEGAGTPAQRLKRHCQALKRFYAGGGKNCLLGAVALGGGSKLFAAELRQSFQGWIDALAVLAREAGVDAKQARRRAELVVAQVQGGLVVARGLGDPKPFQRMLEALPSSLLTGGER